MNETENQIPDQQTETAAVQAELAAPEDVSGYVEDRKEEEKAEQSPQDAEPPRERRASRYERLKRARDQYKAEAEELRQKLEPRPETPQQNPYDEEIEQGRREAEFAHQLQEREQVIAEAATFRARAEQIAPQFEDFDEIIQAARDIGLNVPPPLQRMIMQSPLGPAMAYAIAKDAFDPDGQGFVDHFNSLANDPVAQAREFGKMEQALMMGIERGRAAQPQQQQRATQAPPPMRPISGGSAGGPRDLHSLARSDSADDYIRARRAQDRG
jgi:hypothetical protein